MAKESKEQEKKPSTATADGRKQFLKSMTTLARAILAQSRRSGGKGR
ncbi:MAG: hypothetical protein LUH49_07320 [Cloacibacillus porcorum]|nr:hypothetical protein [Cloacibacillus porcorum]MCD7876758.1 hypothetical protein [Cloacibacillus porcorum]